MNEKLTCPVCGLRAKEYEPWYKPSRGTLGAHLYNAHMEELRQRLANPTDSVIAALRDNGFIVTRGTGMLPIKIKRGRVKR